MRDTFARRSAVVLTDTKVPTGDFSAVEVGELRCTAIGIEITGDLSLDACMAALRELGVIERGSRWAIGDLLVFLGKRYGETYDAAADATGYQAQTLKNMAWVSRRVPPELRHEDVSWGHHRIVAKFEQDEQAEWLEKSAENGWTSAELSRELKRAGEPDNSDDDGGEFSDPEGEARCPACGHVAPAGDFAC
jgi:hypothetical protein